MSFLPYSVARGSWLVALRSPWDSFRRTPNGGALVKGDEELAAFCVENGGDFVQFRVFFVCIVNCVGGDYVQCIDCDDFCPPLRIGQVHCFCGSYSDSQPGEAAGPDRNIDVLDFPGLSAEAVQETVNGREELCTVSHRA